MGIQINGNTNNINAGIGSLSIEDINELDIVGVATAANFKTGVSNLHSLGLTLSGGQLDVGSNIKIGTAGVITATSFVGSGANLTGITQTTINNNANNRIITGSGTANTLEGEANFTYDGGGNLTLNSTVHDGGFNILAANNNQETRLRLQGKASDGTGHSFYINAKRSSNRLDIGTASGAAISVMSTLNVGIQNTGPESPLQIGTGTNAVTNKSTVHVAPASGNASMTLRGGSPTIYFDGTGGGHTRLLTDNTDIAISNGNPDNTGNERFRLRAAGGLCFNGDTAEANALDDYEEGSFTPQFDGLSNTPAYAARNGKYTKIGRYVHITGIIQAGGTLPTFSNTSNILTLTGLPFAGTGVIYYVSLGNLSSQHWNCFGTGKNEANYASGDIDFFNCQMVHNTSTMIFMMGKGGNVRARVRNAACHNLGFIILFELSYTAA